MTLADTDLTAADVAWDIEPLVDGAGAAGVDALLDDAATRARAIAERYRGRIAELDAERAGRAHGRARRRSVSSPVAPGNYAHLRFAVDTADPEAGALLARAEERGTAINNEILFVELEWADGRRRPRRRGARRPAARLLPSLPRVGPSRTGRTC